MPDDEFEIILPRSLRWETRVEIGHNASDWKFCQEDFNYRCAYCGIRRRDTPEKYLVREHVVPISREGTDDISNIVPACLACNLRKGPYCPGEVTRDGWRVPIPRVRHRYCRRK
jgi:5-methylcytosine-specific restriction endonuclease McrA